jgi:hypothetical protein
VDGMQTSKKIINNQLRIKTTLNIVGSHFKHGYLKYMMNDQNKKNQGNFLEMMELLASCNEQAGALILDNASQNAKYTLHQIQK